MRISMAEAQVSQDLLTVLDYLWDDEMKDFANSVPEMKPRRGGLSEENLLCQLAKQNYEHIFGALVRLRPFIPGGGGEA